MLELALVENIQREDLDSIEVAISYQRLIDEIKLTQESLSERVGKNAPPYPTIYDYLNYLPKFKKEFARKGFLWGMQELL